MHDIKHSPGHNHVEQDGQLDGLAGAQLQFFDPTACFQNPMENFDLPPAHVEFKDLAGFVKIAAI
jgi:hypothetical protein